MANSARIVHAKTARATTGTDTQRVYGTDWNADHVLTGLENVDNTSDDTKNAAIATLTNKTIDTAGPNTIKINGNTLAATAGTATVTVPNATDTLVGRATTDTLTNKTLTAPTITGATITTSSYNGNTWTAGTGTLTLGAGKTATISNTLTFTGTDLSSIAFGGGGTVVYTSNNLSAFAATTSAQLAGVISDETGSGSLVFATSPTLVTPTLGVATATSINKVAVTAPLTGATLTIADGTTLTTTANATVSGTNTGDQTITLTGDVTGSGTGSFATAIGATKVKSSMLNADVFSTAHSWSGQQTFVAPILGTPASGTLTNATGLPISTGVSGLGTGVATALAVNVGSAGAAVVNGGALGTPSSGTLTNATGLPPAGLTAQAAYTLLGNATGLSASPSAIDITTLTAKASPVSADIVLIQDSAASNAFKQTTVGALATAGSVSSYNGRTGTVTATTTDVPLPNYLTGLTLSTAGSSATFGIAAGYATDSTNASMMSLGSAYTKTTSAWSVGTANGALDTGTIAANTWYHVYLIKRTDTGVVDVLISTSATSPTLPTNYTLFRRIGSMKTDGSSQWTKFSQNGDEFLWDVMIGEVSVSPGTTNIQTITVTTPTGIKTVALLNVAGNSATGTDGRGWIFSPEINSAAAKSTSNSTINFGIQAATSNQSWGVFRIRTNTSAQIKYAMIASTGAAIITTAGWIDDRGKLGP